MIKPALIPVLLFSTSPTPPEPLPENDIPPELLGLRGDLVERSEALVLADMPTYRPLCDADGYPLVGNALPKHDEHGNVTWTALYQPSQFCAEVRQSQRKA